MQPAVMQTTVASMTAASAAQNATISTLQADKAALQADKAALQADKTTMTTTAAAKDATIIELRATKGAAEQDVPEEKMPTWAIAIIVVVGAMFLLVMVILGVVVSKCAPPTPHNLRSRQQTMRDLSLTCFCLRAVPQGAARQAGLRAEA